MKLIIKLTLLFSLCMPTIALAKLPEQVQADFAVIDGFVVMPINDEYIVDLDARDSLDIGDILTLVSPGKTIFHPVTREVIGTAVDPVGFLQVTRILSGYSYAKVLTPGLEPVNGAPLKRFEQVPARFVDTTDTGDEVGSQVKTNLPQLQWLESGDSERALLIFTFKGKSLVVKNAQGDSLYKYQVTDDQELATPASSLRPAVSTASKPKPKPLQQLANNVMGLFGETQDERFAEIDAAIIRQKQGAMQGIWLGPNLSGSTSAIAVADLDGDNLQETAVVLDNRIVIAQITAGEFNQLAEISIPVRLQVLSIDALDLDGNGRHELYLSALSGNQVSSFVVELKGENYEIVIENIRWFLRAMDLPGQQGRVLIGQMEGSPRVPYLGSPFHVSRDGSRLKKGDATGLPKPLNLFSFVPFLDDHDSLNYAHLTQGDYLKVFSQKGVDLWESAAYFGGSENRFYPSAKDTDDTVIPVRMSPRMVRTSGNEILAVQNDGQRMTANFREFKNSRIVSLAWNGFALVEQWQTAAQRGYLADFALADADNDGVDELVMAVKFKHKGMIDQARSAVVIYEME
jgi:hypothetical protein